MNPMMYLAFLVVAFVCLASALDPTNSTLSLGRPCNPSSSLCTSGVSCYAVNSMQIPTCGSLQATCISTSQCATNTCVNGFCAGPLLPLPGDQCTPSSQNATALSCAFGADCYAVNSMLNTRCGNFQSSCTWDGQCAYNHCVGGFCAGGLLSSASSTQASRSVVTYTSSKFYPANTTSTYQSGYGTGSSMTSKAAPTGAMIYANSTATANPTTVTSLVVVIGETSAAGGGETSFRVGPSQTVSVPNGAASNAIGGLNALGIVGLVMLML